MVEHKEKPEGTNMAWAVAVVIGLFLLSISIYLNVFVGMPEHGPVSHVSSSINTNETQYDTLRGPDLAGGFYGVGGLSLIIIGLFFRRIDEMRS